MIRRFMLIPLLLAVAGTVACDGADTLRVGRDAPPAAAMVAPGLEVKTLDDQLQDLAAELDRAQGGEPERLLNAEAITDQLIHASRSIDWLATGYDVQARLRQLQAMADRIVAVLRRGATLESVEEDVAVMQRAVRDLQAQLARGGPGKAPPTLDSLLAQDPLRDVQAASMEGVTAERDTAEERELPDIAPRVEPVQSGPIGAPVVPPDTTPDL